MAATGTSTTSSSPLLLSSSLTVRGPTSPHPTLPQPQPQPQPQGPWLLLSQSALPSAPSRLQCTCKQRPLGAPALFSPPANNPSPPTHSPAICLPPSLRFSQEAVVPGFAVTPSQFQSFPWPSSSDRLAALCEAGLPPHVQTPAWFGSNYSLSMLGATHVQSMLPMGNTGQGCLLTPCSSPCPLHVGGGQRQANESSKDRPSSPGNPSTKSTSCIRITWITIAKDW